MATTTIQKGEALKIGVGSYTYTGYVMEDVTLEPVADVNVIKNELGVTSTVIISDPASRISFNALIKDSGGSLVPPIIGATVTIATVAYRTESATVNMTKEPGVSKLSFKGIKEGSMTYT